MNALVLGFPDGNAAARRFAAALDLSCGTVEVHRFPDREALVRISGSAPLVFLYRSLDDPDAKLIELLLAASAARDGGARRVVLVAPYLAYMRQDKAFHPGEAVSQRVIGRLIADRFDGLLTIDPHLHRVATLGEAVPGIATVALTAAPLLRGLINADRRPLIVGPDGEAAQWTAGIAAPLGLEVLASTKQRHGDRDISIAIGEIGRVRGRAAILVDDVISSGATLARAAVLLRDAGASSVEALVTHCLAGPEDLARLSTAGIDRVSSTDSVDGPTARVHLAGLLAEAVRATAAFRLAGA